MVIEPTYRRGPLGQKYAEFFKVPEGGPKVEKHARWLGHLKGSWYEIGRLYGEGCGDLIKWVYDGWLSSGLGGARNLGNLVRYDKDHLLQDCYRYEAQIKMLNPGLIDFMKGIADGASRELAQARYARACSDYEKILFVNCYCAIFFNHPSEEEHALEAPISRKIGSGRSASSSAVTDCTGIALLPEATESGKTILTHNTQLGAGMGLYGVAYVASPNQMNRFWSIAQAGAISSTMVANDKGVVIAEYQGGGGEESFGIPYFLLHTDAVASSNTMEEVVECFTVGTEEYREKTGRKTVLREGGNNWMIAEKGRACLVETTARHYAIRYPGDLGEKGFIVGANHQYCKYSYDENNERSNLPMSAFGADVGDPIPSPTEYLGTCTRYWSLYWGAVYNHGRINLPLLMSEQFMASHHWCDKKGNRIDYVKDEKTGKWLPVHYAYDHSTVCGHSGGYPEKFNNELPWSKIFMVDDLTVYWTLGRPCSWEGDWDSVRLR